MDSIPAEDLLDKESVESCWYHCQQDSTLSLLICRQQNELN